MVRTVMASDDGTHRPIYWMSGNQWIECDWDTTMNRYVCHEVDEEDVPLRDREADRDQR